MTDARRAALACFAAAAAWPAAVGWFTALTLSPLERALRDAWCGVPAHAAAMLGHCPACWAGAVLFAAAGASLLLCNRSVIT